MICIIHVFQCMYCKFMYMYINFVQFTMLPLYVRIHQVYVNHVFNYNMLHGYKKCIIKYAYIIYKHFIFNHLQSIVYNSINRARGKDLQKVARSNEGIKQCSMQIKYKGTKPCVGAHDLLMHGNRLHWMTD